MKVEAVSHRPAFSPHPLAVLAAAFACGVLLARFSPLTVRVLVACGALCSAAAVVAFVRGRAGAATALVCAAFACAGGGMGAAEREGVPRDRVRRFYEDGRLASGDAVELTGVLRRAPEVAPDGFYVEVEVEAIRHGASESAASGAVELFAPVRDAATFEKYELLELRRGARVRVLVRLERGDEFRNPGVSSLTEFLERRGLEAAGLVKSPLLVERLNDEPVFVPLVWLERWRARVHERLTAVFTRETAGALQASILGNRHGLSRATAEAMREGGTFHVLVISGLHISFVGGLALFVARKLTRSRAAQFASSACLLWAYALAVGAEASVVRAALMFTLVALAPLVARRGAALNAAGGAALALLAWRPAELFDPSFQLTFLSVLGIVLIGWPLVERLRAAGEWRPTRETPYPPRGPRWFRALGESLYWSERAWAAEAGKQTHSCRLFKSRWAGRLERWRVQRVLRYACAAVAVSAGVQSMLLPLMVVYFHRLSFASLALNVFVGALAAVASLGALAAVAAAAAVSETLAAPLVWAVERAVWLMAHSTSLFGDAASVRLPDYAGAASLVYALYYVPLAALLRSLARWRPLAPPPSSSREREATDEKTATTDEKSDARVRRRGRLHERLRERLRAAFGRVTDRVLVRRAAWVACAAASFVVVAHPWSAPRADGRLRVDFLDVGQGDAALLTLPDGTTVLVDAGGRPSFGARAAAGGAGDDAGSSGDGEAFERDARGIGERVVSEFLWRRGLDRVDYLLATHAHADHVQGLTDVARAFRVRAAFAGRAETGAAEFVGFDETLRRAGVPLLLVGRGDVLRAGGASLEVLWPPRAPEESAGRRASDGSAARASDESAAARASPARAASGRNDDSVVLRVRFGRRCFLLTGDIERRAEAALLAAGDDLRCDVVKAAHHGSRTSSTEGFVAATRARFAVIPVGLDSPFGHPDARVVARWRAAGAEVLQTGRRGTITFTTDGERLTFETFVRE